MEVVEVTQNDYKRNFISIKIDGRESFNGKCYKNGFDYAFTTKDKSGQTHIIEIRRERVNKPLTGELLYYKNCYSVGAGSGSCMGWRNNPSIRDAVAIARAKMAACESMRLVAGVYLVNYKNFSNQF